MAADYPISHHTRDDAMARIFISYRREDSAGWTGRLAEQLKQKFGSESIFMDIDTIQPGTDFTEAVRSAVAACDLLLAMIGPEWLSTKNADGQLRLEDPNDWVRIELTTALSRNIPIIPVLVGGASVPKLKALPENLTKLFHYQSHELTDKRWEYDTTQLLRVLENVLHGLKPKRYIAGTLLTRPSTWAAVGVLGLILGGAVQFLKSLEGFERSVSETSRSAVAPPSEASTRKAVDTTKRSELREKGETQYIANKNHSAVSQQNPEIHIATSTAPLEKVKSETPAIATSSGAINLLSQENGGHIVVADNKEWWPKTIDGDEKRWEYIGIGVDNHWVVYGFKDDRPATFDTFKMLILETASTNLKEFELLSGNDSPMGHFEPIGTFQTQNVAFFDDPWQKFKFPAVTARYLKVRPISSYGFSSIAAYEFQLIGVLGK